LPFGRNELSLHSENNLIANKRGKNVILQKQIKLQGQTQNKKILKNKDDLFP
jgi:hypothetical protein